MITYKLPVVKLTLHVKEPRNYQPVLVRKPESIVDFLKPLMQSPNEQFVVLHLNNNNEIVGVHTVSEGTVNSSLVHPREVFKGAMLNNATSVILAHNHPAGSLMASSDDIETTEKLLASGEILGISVLDHVIVTPQGKHVSVRTTHPNLKW